MTKQSKPAPPGAKPTPTAPPPPPGWRHWLWPLALLAALVLFLFLLAADNFDGHFRWIDGHVAAAH